MAAFYTSDTLVVESLGVKEKVQLRRQALGPGVNYTHVHVP